LTRYILAIIGAALLCVVPAWADDGPPVQVAPGSPVAVINGPTQTDPGNLCVFTSDGSVGAQFKWAIFPQEKWAGRYFIAEQGRTVIFASNTPGTLTLVLATCVDNEVALAVHEMTNGDDPGPGPGPDPPPPPPPPPGPQKKVVNEETSQSTPKQRRTIDLLREWADNQGIDYRLTDKDVKTETGQRPEWFGPFHQFWATSDVKSKLPVVLVGIPGTGESETHVLAVAAMEEHSVDKIVEAIQPYLDKGGK